MEDFESGVDLINGHHENVIFPFSPRKVITRIISTDEWSVISISRFCVRLIVGGLPEIRGNQDKSKNFFLFF